MNKRTLIPLLAALPVLFFCVSAYAQILSNPLTATNITQFVATTLKVIVMIALPIIGFFIVLAGFQFIWARGNSSQLEKAKVNFMWVIIGSALVLGAWVLANMIGSTLSQIVS